MKQKILLKSFLVLAFLFGVQVNASEIVGNLSSSNTQVERNGGTGGETSNTIDNGKILAGNVEGGSTSTNNSYFTSDGTSVQPISSNSFNLETTINENIDGSVLGAETTEAASVVQNTTKLDESNIIVNNYWLWIILLVLLVLTIMIYANSRKENTYKIK